MFTNISMAGTGMYITLIELVLHALGITPESGSVAAFVNAVVVVIGFALWIISQFQRRDLHAGLVRKEPRV